MSQKVRLTITLSDDVLSRVDQIIDGKEIRNRSHAIETLVSKQLYGEVSQAVVLAGGKAEAIDQALTAVAGRPLIEHLINLLKSYRIGKIMVLTDRQNKRLAGVLARFEGVELIVQSTNLGTAGALYEIKDNLGPQPVVVMHGDIFTDINLEDMVRFHLDQGAPVTIGVKPKLHQKEFGKAQMAGTKIEAFLSSPKEPGVGMVNTGVYIIDPKTLELLPKNNKPLMLETDLFPLLADKRQLNGFLFEGIWYDVSNRK